jgi:hypothetical protein
MSWQSDVNYLAKAVEDNNEAQLKELNRRLLEEYSLADVRAMNVHAVDQAMPYLKKFTDDWGKIVLRQVKHYRSSLVNMGLPKGL